MKNLVACIILVNSMWKETGYHPLNQILMTETVLFQHILTWVSWKLNIQRSFKYYKLSWHIQYPASTVHRNNNSETSSRNLLLPKRTLDFLEFCYFSTNCTGDQYSLVQWYPLQKEIEVLYRILLKLSASCADWDRIACQQWLYNTFYL